MFADWLYYIEGSRLATYKAAWMLSEGLPSAKAVSIAKAFTSDAYQQITPWAHVIIGGVGFCEEHDMPHYFRQAKAAEVAFGDADFHRELIAQQLGL
jgi:alkylation response protein AidB-like acyl-CoA dehydrogenase